MADTPHSRRVPTRWFTFACGPVERIALCCAILAAPTIAGRMIYVQHRTALSAGTGLFEMLEERQALWLTLFSATLAAVVVVFALLYLTYRGRTRVGVDTGGVTMIVPRWWSFGLSRRTRRVAWDEVVHTSLDMRWRLALTAQPLLSLHFRGQVVRLNVSFAWEEATDRRRPWFVKRPSTGAGWRDHPLVKAVNEACESRSSKGG